MKDWDKTEMWT